MLSPRAPVTSILTYGPLDGEGMMRVRLLFDHRVYDGAAAASVLARLDEILRGPIYDEIEIGCHKRPGQQSNIKAREGI